MRDAHPLERAVGMRYYVSDSDGTGGTIRAADSDFRVTELEDFETQSVDADVGAYPHLVVRARLTGWDTNDFVRELSNRLEMSRERISWAGTKDKRAVTTQLFSLDRVEPSALPEIRGVEFDVVGRTGRGLQFGDLAGNRFEIVVREVERPDVVTDIESSLSEFGGGTVGVPNYFGQQRFGSVRPVSHEVGLAIAREDWEGAVMTYVGNPAESEPDGTREAREYVDETRDFAGALDRFPKRLGFERSMLHRLVENGAETPAEYRDALGVLPSNLQRLFVHAAQSYAFNLMLSERLERGLPFDEAVPGDVVCFAERSGVEGLTLPDPDRLQVVTEDRVDVINRHVSRGRAFVTAPLVGTETELGEGEPGEIARDVLDDLALSPSDFDLPGVFESTGTRRAILLRTDLEVTRDPLTFRFALPKGAYATVVLREFLKVDPVALG